MLVDELEDRASLLDGIVHEGERPADELLHAAEEPIVVGVVLPDERPGLHIDRQDLAERTLRERTTPFLGTLLHLVGRCDCDAVAIRLGCFHRRISSSW